MIYFISDTHFFYRKSSPHVGRRSFRSREEKNEFLISRWNDTVKTEDEVYILGDFSDGSAEETERILERLKGRKYLVIGNNDHYLEDPSFHSSLFQWTKQYYELHAMDTKFVLFHFPIEAWSGYRNDRVHLHGHVHRPQPVYEPIRRYEVGADAHDGRPVSIEEIWAAVKGFHNFSRRMPGIS
ncbi:MAG: metallophosphoesterase [Enterocloster sp.]